MAVPFTRDLKAAAPARAYDEAIGDDGAPRPQYAAVMARLAEHKLAALRDDVQARLAAEGVMFGGDAAWPFTVCPVPRIVTAGEWHMLAAGLEQRVRALDAFVHDAYGARRIVAEGLMDDASIDSTEGYEPSLRGAWPDDASALGVSGLDVIRESDGTLLVLEDNVRTPSGLAYASAARRAVEGALGAGLPAHRDVAGPFVALLHAALLHAAPAGVDDPQIVVLTDGPSSVAHYEHQWLAEQLDLPLVTLADLERSRFGGLCRREAERRFRVDVVYRRNDDDRVVTPEGGLTPVAAALLEPWQQGKLGLVNGFGTGVADDKLTHAHVEEMIRLYLGEEPLVRSVPTLDLRFPDALATVLDDPRAYVIKDRHGQGGSGVTVCRDADDAALDALLAMVRGEPDEYIAQRTVSLSVHPTVVDDGVLEPRHVDLRPFVFSTADGPRAAPGGLTRVALRRGSLIVNSSQQGGAKDTWVLAE